MRRSGRTSSRRVSSMARRVLIVGLPLAGGLPLVSVSGRVVTGTRIEVDVTAGVLGVSLITVRANGQAVISSVISSPSVSLGDLLGFGSGVSLSLGAGTYLVNTYSIMVTA